MCKMLRFCPADKTLLSLEEERHLGRKRKFFLLCVVVQFGFIVFPLVL